MVTYTEYYKPSGWEGDVDQLAIILFQQKTVMKLHRVHVSGV